LKELVSMLCKKKSGSSHLQGVPTILGLSFVKLPERSEGCNARVVLTTLVAYSLYTELVGPPCIQLSVKVAPANFYRQATARDTIKHPMN